MNDRHRATWSTPKQDRAKRYIEPRPRPRHVRRGMVAPLVWWGFMAACVGLCVALAWWLVTR